jgi:hypothetical protein
MKPYFCQLPIKDTIIKSLKKELIRTDWVENHGFQILKLSPMLFKSSTLFDCIIEKHGVPVIFKMEPMTWYDWHTDATRQCSINMLIDGDKSKCFFGDRKSRDIVNITELVYEPYTCYLLNTQIKHAVLNLDNTRYMLSIGFDEPNNYQDILTYCNRIS